MPERLARFPGAGWLALVGAAFVVVLAPLGFGRESLAGLPLDTIVLTVPIAILLAVPLLTRTGRAGIPRIGIEVPASVFLGWALLSAIATGAQPGVLATWARYASYVVLVYAVATVTADAGRRRVLLWLIAIAGSATVVQGFMQYINPTVGIGMQGLDTSVATRVFATFDNPNFYAEYLVLLFAVTLALLFVERGPLRYVAAALLSAQAIALLLTYTRGSWLALVLGIAIALLMIDGRLIWPFVLGGSALLPLAPGAMARMLSVFSLEGTASFRLKLWEVAGIAMAKRPLFGMGMGRFYDAFKDAVLNSSQLNVGVLIYGAHNSYFQLGAEIGVVGMIAFAWFVLEACRMGAFYNRRMGTDLQARLANAALTAGLVAFAINALTSNAFQHPRGAVFFFVLAGVQAGLGMEYWKSLPKAVSAQRQSANVWTRSLIGRAFTAAARGLSLMWQVSAFHHVVVREPEGGGHLLADSLIARWLFGNGVRHENSVSA